MPHNKTLRNDTADSFSVIDPTESLTLLPDGTGWGTVGLLVVAAFAAGWIDAVVGGGGLLQLPALLLVPGITPVQALATNKLASVFGTTSSSVVYVRRVRPRLHVTIPMALVAAGGSVGGAAVAVYVPGHLFRPFIVVALIVVALVTIFKPRLGVTPRAHSASITRTLALALPLGFAIGIYDGILGPGTGTFLIFGLVGLLGLDFLRASAKAKVVNVATNIGALAFFIPAGAVLWPLGLVMAFANTCGSIVGSRMAIGRGVRFIRGVFLVVVVALIVKLGFDVLADLFPELRDRTVGDNSVLVTPDGVSGDEGRPAE